MPPESSSDWERLGRLLAQRRVQIGARYRNKNLFAEERQINRRMVWSVESGARRNYGRDTLRVIEAAYMLVPGSVARALAGGDLEPLPVPQPAAVPLSGSGTIAAPGGDDALAREAAILFPGDATKQAIWRTDEPRDVKLEIIAVIDRKRGTVSPARGEPAAGLSRPQAMRLQLQL